MQLLSEDALNAASLSPEQRLFVDSLYQMIHLESLDSYRAKCLNLRTILAELRHELQTGRLEEDELKMLTQEVAEVLETDPLGRSTYTYQTSVLLPLLKTPPAKPKKSEKEDAQKLRNHHDFAHCVGDFSAELDQTYFTNLCQAIPNAIWAKDADKIIALTGAILSDLVYQGYSYSSLYGWHKNFLKDPREYTFESNLRLMLRVLQQPLARFRVTLQLSGSEKPASIGSKGQFRFEKEPPLPDDADERVRRFLKPHRLRTFASCEIESPDHEAAAVQARAEAEFFLDLMRLEYEHNPVTIEPEVHSIRLRDGRGYLVRVKTLLPNPVEDMTHEEFMQFAASVEKVLSNHQIVDGTQEQVRAAIRQYRIGRDSLRPQDKCLHWWMGLEELAYTGGGYIGQSVVHNVSRVLVCDYLFNLIRDLVITLKHCRIDWTADLRTATGCDSLKSLSVAQLLALLQDAANRAKLWSECKAHPIIAWHGELLGKALETAESTGALIKRHLSHLEWQISRLYRIRCCIVHGSETIHTLYPFAANLEYYLKQLILFVLKRLSNHSHIRSRQDLFQRASFSLDRKLNALTASNDKAVVWRAVFEDIVLK
jgi:hypothetical protein